MDSRLDISPTSPRRRASDRPIPASSTVLAADIASYGYAAAVVAATLHFGLQFRIVEGIAIMAIFVLLRYVARELRADHRRRVVATARTRSDLRATSPSRWTIEQRDGAGRRVDARS